MTKEWLDMVARQALSSRETIEATYDLCRLVIAHGVAGDFVECGVYAGAQCAAMAQALMHTGEAGRRKIHLFDSFAGIPKAGDRDQLEMQVKPAGESAFSIERVKRNMQDWAIPAGLFVYHEGLFSSTVPAALRELDRTRIAFLRLDGDLYSSTKDCVPLLSLVTRGGWVCVDDWNLSGCQTAIQETLVPAPVYWKYPLK